MTTLHFNQSEVLNFIPEMESKAFFKYQGLLFQDLGWASIYLLEQFGTESPVSLGIHKKGVVLEAMKEMSGNRLVGWYEQPMLLYEHWMEIKDKKCYRVFRNSQIPEEDSYQKSVSINPVEVTSLCHCSWDNEDLTRFYCERFRDWFRGATPLNNIPAIMIQEHQTDALPEGFTLTGTIGEKRRRVLEWPSENYYHIINKIEEWKGKATEIRLCKGGFSVDIADGFFETKTSKIIEANYKRYGADFSFLDMYRM